MRYFGNTLTRRNNIVHILRLIVGEKPVNKWQVAQNICFRKIKYRT